jgi:hypothetical protein
MQCTVESNQAAIDRRLRSEMTQSDTWSARRFDKTKQGFQQPNAVTTIKQQHTECDLPTR